MPQLLTNAARALLTGAILGTDTSVPIEAAKADLFPVANTGTSAVNTSGLDWFKAVLQDSAGNIEIVYVRTRASAGAVLSNVIRAQEGTTARAFAAGSVLGLRITALDVQAAIAVTAASAVVNTPAGNIVATNVQAALNELDAEKALLAGSATQAFAASTFTGALSGNATTATTASTLAGGLGGSVPYQSAAGTTAMLANGAAGQLLQSNGTTLAPSFAGGLATTTPLAESGAGAVGVGTTYARNDHVHPAGGVTSVNGAIGAVTVAAAGATCTYTGSLVESGPIATVGTGTVDLGANRVVTGIRTTTSPDLYTAAYIHIRGYNIKNN